MGKYISIFSGIVIFIVTISTFYYQVIFKPQTIIEIQCLDKTQLTQLPNVDGLSGHFLYNDSIPVQNLWKIKYLLKNIGDVNIIGEGNASHLIGGNLPFEIASAIRILDVDITNNNMDAILINNRLGFKQWRPTEYVEITAFVECANNKQPSFLMNSRDIIDADIKYTEFLTRAIDENKKIIDYFPKRLVNTLKWITAIVTIFLYLIAIPAGVASFKSTQGKAARITFIVMFIIFFTILLMPFLWVF